MTRVPSPLHYNATDKVLRVSALPTKFKPLEPFTALLERIILDLYSMMKNRDKGSPGH